MFGRVFSCNAAPVGEIDQMHGCGAQPVRPYAAVRYRPRRMQADSVTTWGGKSAADWTEASPGIGILSGEPRA